MAQPLNACPEEAAVVGWFNRASHDKGADFLRTFLFIPWKIYALMSHMQTDKWWEKRRWKNWQHREHKSWFFTAGKIGPKISSYATAHSCANIPTTVTTNELNWDSPVWVGAMWLHGVWQYTLYFCLLHINTALGRTAIKCQSRLSLQHHHSPLRRPALYWKAWWRTPCT